MLRANWRDLSSQRDLELKPRSFATLLQYLEARLSTKPKLLRRTIASRHVTRQRFGRVQRPITPKLAPTLRTFLMVFLAMIVIYVTLAYLRALLDRIVY